MSTFQIIMLLVSAFFAYKMYEFIQNMDPNAEPESIQEAELISPEPTADEMIEEADAAYSEGDLDKAQLLLENIVGVHPDLAEGHNKLGFVLAKQGDLEKAEEHYIRSLELEPNDDMTHNALAGMLASVERNTEAEEHYRKAVAIDGSYAPTWFNYANFKLRLGQTEEAKEMYEKALQSDPDFEQAREELEKLS